MITESGIIFSNLMKKRKKKSSSSILPLILIILISILVIFLKTSNFGKPVPDVVAIPQDVLKSIENVKPQKSFRLPILMYHYVEYVKDSGDTIRKSLNIIPFIFDQQVKTLKDAGYTFITTSDLADALDDKRPLPQKSVILTFDDGYRDFYTDVLPILKKYQVKAVVYVVPNFLDKQNNLDSWMVVEATKSGLVEIGAHTMDHSYLTGLGTNRIQHEVLESKKYLEKNFNILVSSFAYPYGAFDNGVISIVKQAGFKTAVTTIPGRFSMDVNRFFLYRTRPGVKVGTELLNLLEVLPSAQY